MDDINVNPQSPGHGVKDLLTIQNDLLNAGAMIDGSFGDAESHMQTVDNRSLNGTHFGSINIDGVGF